MKIYEKVPSRMLSVAKEKIGKMPMIFKADMTLVSGAHMLIEMVCYKASLLHEPLDYHSRAQSSPSLEPSGSAVMFQWCAGC